MLIHKVIVWAVAKTADGFEWVAIKLTRLELHMTATGGQLVPFDQSPEVYGWAMPGNGLDAAQERCPICLDKEFPLTPYNGKRMCLSCKDDAVITDKAIPSTVNRHAA